MTIELNAEDARVLREMLQDYLPELKWETARTEKRPMRHEMAERQDLCERLIAQLSPGVPA